MRLIYIVILIIALTSCAAYKIDMVKKSSPGVPSESTYDVLQTNDFPSGAHCFEPYLFVLSLGIIPTHCIDTYSVQNKTVEVAMFEVISMSGWAALVLVPFQKWRFGWSENVEPEILSILKEAN